MPKAATTCFFYCNLWNFIWKSVKSMSKAATTGWFFSTLWNFFLEVREVRVKKPHIDLGKMKYPVLLVKCHPGEILNNLAKVCEVHAKSGDHRSIFLAFSATFLESPWSPCQNATYGLKKKCSLFPVKGHPGEIFRTSILSPWSPCQDAAYWFKRRKNILYCL